MRSVQNRRHGERVVFERGFPVLIMGIDGTWRRQCTILDASETGAKLILNQGTLNALESKEFFLLLSSVGNAFRRCELAWVNGDQFGAQFVQERKLTPKARPSRQPDAIEI